ncbi:MAG: ABC transporter permease [Acidobacteriota bacterium]
MRRSSVPAHACARLLVRGAALVAPRAARSEFRAEWLAELHWSAADIDDGRRPAAASRELVRRALGAFVHALWLRKEQWSLDMLWQDLKYAVRVLRGRPSFTLVAGLTLALGIGANTAIFSLVYGVLLKPLPFHDPDRLVQLWETNQLRDWTDATASPANLLDWRRRNRVFEGIAFYPGMDDRTPMFLNGNLADPNGEPERLRGLEVSANFFDVLGVAPSPGRPFTPRDELPGQNRVVILSDALWRGQFGGDPKIVGRDIRINTRAYRVIGVMPAGFRFPSPQVDLWMPFVMDEDTAALRRPHFLRPVARLKPGVTIAQARGDLQRIARELEREYPDTNTRMSADLGPLHEWIVGDVRRALLVFLAAVGAVLLVACANLANLFLARAIGRRREFAIRAALGSEGWRIVRQVLTESAVLALAGGVCGLLAARWALEALLALAPAGIPRVDEVALDGRVLVFVAALTTLTALLFGLLPAIHSARPEGSWLRDTSTTKTGGTTIRRALVVGQVAASVALVVCAGLLLRSFARLQAVPSGLDPHGVLTFTVALPSATYDEEPKQVQFYESLLRRVREIPGVISSGATTVLGLEGQGWTGDLFIEGRPDVHGRELRHKDVTEGYFRAVGLPIVRGRDVTDHDTARAPLVVVVNQALVRQYFAGEDPLGKRISFSYDPQHRRWCTIVGVVQDEKQDGLGEPVQPEVYGTYRQNASGRLTVAVRASVPPSSLVPALRAELRAQDSAVAMFDVRTLEDVVNVSLARERFTAWIVALFAVLALIIAAVGVYGVVAYSVSRRTPEIGLRVALGATRREISGLVLRETFALVSAGVIAGFALSVVAGRAISSLLFETTSTDPVTYITVVAVLGCAGFVASWIPLRRALRVDPVTALRYE